MKISNSSSGLSNQNTNDSCIYFQDKALSTYLYIKNFRQINLEKKMELEKAFLIAVLSPETITSISDIYLNVLKSYNTKKFESLRHDNVFDLDEVLDSLTQDLRDDFQTYGGIFFLQEQKEEGKYVKTNPLKELIDKPYMQDFFNGLELSYSARVLFILAMANEEWAWLFPEHRDEAYKSSLFCHICGIDKKDTIGYSRKINSRLIQLGLFSSPWKINRYVYSYFKNETPSFSLQKINLQDYCDIYDYKETAKLNQQGLEIIRMMNGFSVIQSDSDYRNKYFLTDYFHDCYDNLYEIKQEYSGISESELEFYIYALSLQVKNDAMFINKTLCTILLHEKSENQNESIHIVSKRNSGILNKIKSRVILSMDNFSEDDRSYYFNQGIDVLYALKLKLPKKQEYKSQLINFCLKEHIPVNLLMGIAHECEELRIEPEQWKTLINLLSKASYLREEETIEIIRNRYSTNDNKDKLRKNGHYCIEALNTSEPINEVTDALKNADEYQNGQYDEESGIKVLLYGISGGGKTAYAEEVSKRMNRSLKIVRPSEVLSKWVGETEQNISRIFKEAAKNRSILLVDEADSFLHNRGDSVNHFEDSKVNSFLIEIERYPGILFCSTNLPDILDKAVDRRFNFKVGFKSLTEKGINLLCQSYFSSFEFDKNQISKIYNCGEVTPGDFAVLNDKLRFLATEKQSAEYITEELCRIIQNKKRSYESNKIGFGG